MAVTPVLKPKGIQPVGGGSLIYTFQEGASISAKPNYRLQISVNGYAPILEFRPDATLLITCDVAPLLRGLLKLVETPALRMIGGAGTYVKYQTMWDGGTDGLTSLSGDVIYPFIGIDTQLNHRTIYTLNNGGFKFLIPTTKLYCWNNRTINADFIIDGASSPLGSKSAIAVKSSDPTLYPDFFPCEFDGSVFGLNACNFKPLNNPYLGFVNDSIASHVSINETNQLNSVKLYPGSADYGNGIGQSWQAVSSGPANRRYFVFYARKIGKPTYTTTFRMVKFSGASPSTNPVDIVKTFTFDLTQMKSTYTAFVVDLSNVVANTATDYFLEIVPNNDGFYNSTNYYEYPQSNASTYANGSVWNKPVGTFVADTGRDFYCYYVEYIGGSFNVTNHLSLVTVDECRNPIYLKWINDNGGVSNWLFDFNQIATLQPQDIGRFLKKQLYAKALLPEIWYMLQELNKDGIEYGNNLRAGQYVYDITDETNPIPVLPMPQLSSYETRQVQTKMQMTLRYPLINNLAV